MIHTTDEDFSLSEGKLLAHDHAIRTSLVIQWFRCHDSNAMGVGSIPGPGTKIPHAIWPWEKEKEGTKIMQSASSKSELESQLDSLSSSTSRHKGAVDSSRCFKRCEWGRVRKLE